MPPKNPQLRKSYRDKPCAVCGRTPSDPSHIKTYGHTRTDAEFLIYPKCRRHHVEWGQTGALTFLRKYPDFWKQLQRDGWELNSGKLFHPELLGESYEGNRATSFEGTGTRGVQGGSRDGKAEAQDESSAAPQIVPLEN